MKRILVADDNRQFAELLRATLEDAGYEVLTAHSGLAAATVADTNELDLAILDVLLPGVSGDVIAERLRQTHRKLPILLITGAGDEFTRGLNLPVLRKPFREEDLLARVAKMIGAGNEDDSGGTTTASPS